MTDEIPEISVQELAEKIKKDEKFTLLDVREQWELSYAHITDERVVALPMSLIARHYKDAFSEELLNLQTEIIVMCHHGVRSANVTGWMRQNGWLNVYSLAGGIAAYADEIDSSVGTY